MSSADQPDLEPGTPQDVGVEEESTGFSRTEGAHLLANDARSTLEAQGFTYAQVLAWAETYLSRRGSGEVRAFLAWIDEQQPDADG